MIALLSVYHICEVQFPCVSWQKERLRTTYLNHNCIYHIDNIVNNSMFSCWPNSASQDWEAYFPVSFYGLQLSQILLEKNSSPGNGREPFLPTKGHWCTEREKADEDPTVIENFIETWRSRKACHLFVFQDRSRAQREGGHFPVISWSSANRKHLWIIITELTECPERSSRS